MEYLIWFLWFGAGGAFGILTMGIFSARKVHDLRVELFNVRLKLEQMTPKEVVLGEPDSMTSCTHEFGGVTVTGDRYTRECRKCGYGELFS